MRTGSGAELSRQKLIAHEGEVLSVRGPRVRVERPLAPEQLRKRVPRAGGQGKNAQVRGAEPPWFCRYGLERHERDGATVGRHVRMCALDLTRRELLGRAAIEPHPPKLACSRPIG